MSQDHNAPPFNPLPPVVTLLAVALFGAELAIWAGGQGLVGGPGGVGWRIAMAEKFGFYQPLLGWMIDSGQIRWDYMMRFVTYPFVSAGFSQMVFAVVFLLAFGKMVGELFSQWAVLVIWFGSAIVGALTYGLLFETRVMLLGGLVPAYGLVGAYTFVLWVGLGAKHVNRAQAFTLIAVLMGIQVLFALLFGGMQNMGDIIAKLAAFAGGFVLSFVVSPGGWSKVVAKLRQRG